MIKKEKVMKENLQVQSATTDPLPLTDITEKIIGCAYTVYNKMGFGFLESV